MKFPEFFCVVFTLVALPQSGSGQELSLQSVPRESLPDLIQAALQTHPELEFYQAELAAARAFSQIARHPGDTEWSSSVGRKSSREPNGGGGDGWAWSMGVSQTFEWPGRLALRKAIADRNMEWAELGLSRFRRALVSRIRGEAMTLSAARQKAAVAREVADRYRQLRDTLVMRDPSGIAPQLELRVLEATELTIRKRATEAELKSAEAEMSLNQLLGRPVSQALRVDVPDDMVLPEAPSEEGLLQAARTNHFGLLMKVLEVEQQGFRVALAKNERWPAFKVGPEFSEEKAGTRDRLLGLAISVPLPLWRNTSARVALEKARQIQAETLLERQRLDTERSVLLASRSYRMKRDELALWNENSVRHFSEAAMLADRHYRLGAVPASTYVELQRQYLDAVETLLDTRIDAIMAGAQLEEITGVTLIPEFKQATP